MREQEKTSEIKVGHAISSVMKEDKVRHVILLLILAPLNLSTLYFGLNTDLENHDQSKTFTFFKVLEAFKWKIIWMNFCLLVVHFNEK